MPSLSEIFYPLLSCGAVIAAAVVQADARGWAAFARLESGRYLANWCCPWCPKVMSLHHIKGLRREAREDVTRAGFWAGLPSN